MPKMRALQHISRIDQPRKHQHGWWVRIQRDGEKIQSFFSDVAHGGQSHALRKAKAYRDQLLINYPKPEYGNMFNRTNSRNTSGKAGVHKTRSLKRGRAYDVWQASWVLPNGKHINKKFAFSPEGRSEREAKRLAIKAREEGVALIKQMRLERAEKRAAQQRAAKRRHRRHRRASAAKS